MEFKGYIRKVEDVPAVGERRAHLRLTIVENWGKKDDANQFATWYSARAYSLDELTKELLGKGAFVHVTGKLRPYAFVKEGDKEASAGLDVLVVKIEPIAANAPSV